MFYRKDPGVLAVLICVAMLPALAQVGAFVALSLSNFMVGLMFYSADVIGGYLVPVAFALLVVRETELLARRRRGDASLAEITGLLITTAMLVATAPVVRSKGYSLMASDGFLMAFAGVGFRALASAFMLALIVHVTMSMRELGAKARRRSAV